MRMEELPHWVLTDKHPAFNDKESLTAIEMVSRVYGKVQELIDEYNKYVAEVNKEIENFESGITTDYETFKANINKIMHDYIAMIDEKIVAQDAEIVELSSVTFVCLAATQNLVAVVNTLFLSFTIKVGFIPFVGSAKVS